MNTKHEIQALKNSLKYFEIKADINVFNFNDKRKKPKFVLSKDKKFYSPKMDYNEMNRFIYGIAMSKQINF